MFNIETVDFMEGLYSYVKFNVSFFIKEGQNNCIVEIVTKSLIYDNSWVSRYRPSGPVPISAQTL